MTGIAYIHPTGFVARKQTASSFILNVPDDLTISTPTGYDDGDELTYLIASVSPGTLTWAGTFRFAGGSGPSFSSAGTSLVIKFVYSSTYAYFFELSRSEDVA